MINALIQADTELFLLLNSLAGNSFFDGFNLFVSDRYVWTAALLLFGMFVFRKMGKKAWRPSLVVLLSLALSDWATYWVLKPEFGRERPCRTFSSGDVVIQNKGGCASKYGFPSNHASNSAAIATSVYLMVRTPAAAGLFGLMFVIGLSRIFLGVHYPADILVGFLTGFLYGAGLYWIAKKTGLWRPVSS